MKILNLKSKIFWTYKDSPQTHHMGGFTVIEIILVLVILLVLVTISIPNFVFFLESANLDNNTEEFVGILRTAQNKTLASESNSKYGIYLDTSVLPNKYILFKGNSYALRDSLYDMAYLLNINVEFFSVNLGGGSEIVFDKLTGLSQQSGNISLRLKTDASQIKTIYISSSGSISFIQTANSSDENRLKDSRHTHFDYIRIIDTVNESITLTFDGSAIQVIPISSYLVGDELVWEGTVDVGGIEQSVKVKTHRLNNLDTQFSIQRDRRVNDKTLVITISGDSSGNLISYSADGLTTANSSIYVSNLAWQ